MVRKSAELVAVTASDDAEARQSSLHEEVVKQRTTRCFCLKLQKESVRTIQLTTWLLVLILIGGGVFNGLEEQYEIQRIATLRNQTAEARARVLALLGNNSTLYSLIDAAAQTKMGTTAFEPVVDYANHWSFSSSCLFSFTVVTTIGYGTFAPATIGGQIFLVFYALLGIPAAGISLVYLADRALYMVTWLMTMKSDKVKEAFESYDDDNSGALDLDEFKAAVKHLGISVTETQFEELVQEVDADGSGQVEEEEFEHAVRILHADVTDAAGRKNRIKIVLFAISAWIGIGLLTFSLVEGWDAETSFYFSFVTLTTIGLGDFFPATTGGRIFLLLFAMIGLGLLAVLLTLIEGLLEDYHRHQKEALKRMRDAAITARQRGTFAKAPLKNFGKKVALGLRIFRTGSSVSQEEAHVAAVGRQVQEQKQELKQEQVRQSGQHKHGEGVDTMNPLNNL